MSMTEIETKTRDYAERRAALTHEVQKLQSEIEAIKRKRLDKIKQLVGEAAEAHAQLHASVEAAPELFEKPKTQTFAGVRVGYTKQRGQVIIEDQAKTIKRIREQLPADQADMMIRVKETVHKPAVYDLSGADLKRLGITVTNDTDIVTIKPVDSETDKLVNALLAEAEDIGEAA